MIESLDTSSWRNLLAVSIPFVTVKLTYLNINMLSPIFWCKYGGVSFWCIAGVAPR